VIAVAQERLERADYDIYLSIRGEAEEIIEHAEKFLEKVKAVLGGLKDW